MGSGCKLPWAFRENMHADLSADKICGNVCGFFVLWGILVIGIQSRGRFKYNCKTILTKQMQIVVITTINIESPSKYMSLSVLIRQHWAIFNKCYLARNLIKHSSPSDCQSAFKSCFMTLSTQLQAFEAQDTTSQPNYEHKILKVFPSFLFHQPPTIKMRLHQKT